MVEDYHELIDEADPEILILNVEHMIPDYEDITLKLDQIELISQAQKNMSQN